MSKHKHIDIICCVVMMLAILGVILLLNLSSSTPTVKQTFEYENKIFDTSLVHTIDIQIDDWDGFLETAEDEAYEICSLVIDGETCNNVAIRAKGNTSLSQVKSYGNDRYSFKVEFDHYNDGANYYGLDKLCLNNIIQDTTYMKDYLTYQMMNDFGVNAPLCSFTYITVNGEDWGLYLAVEGVEESFLQRNYGSQFGQLYKPDSMDMGGGRGNGKEFDMDDFSEFSREKKSAADENSTTEEELTTDAESKATPTGQMPSTSDMPTMPMREFDPDSMPTSKAGDKSIKSGFGGNFNMGGFGGSSDVSLIYTDDEYSSYENIFDSAKTEITNKDKTRLISSLKQLNQQENLDEILDIEQVMRYFVVHNFVLNFDSYTGSMIHNYYLYENDGQMAMIPWDYNLAFGGFQASSSATSLINYPIDTPVSGGSLESRPMVSWIFSNETYVQEYHSYFSKFIADFFDSGYFSTQMDSVYSLIAPYVEKDPTKFCSYEEFETGFSTLKQFCSLRAQSISGQLSGTIPATQDGQTGDSSAFVDGSSLTISAMGEMGFGKGGKDGNNFPSPNDTDFSDKMTGQMPPSPSRGNAQDSSQGQMQDLPQGKMQDPSQGVPQSPPPSGDFSGPLRLD